MVFKCTVNTRFLLFFQKHTLIVRSVFVYVCEVKFVDSETTHIILHGLFGGVKLLMIGAATWLMN